MLKHVALQIKISDLNEFYVRILGGEIEGNFTIYKEISSTVFNIPEMKEVYYLNLDGLVLELFVHESELPENFNHICLQMSNAKSIREKAENAGYPVYIHKTYKGETYFIHDHNKNLFEIKPDWNM